MGGVGTTREGKGEGGYVSSRTGWGISICMYIVIRASLYSPVEFSGEWDGKSLAVGAFEGPCSNKHEHDRAPAHDAAPHRSSPSHAQTLHDQVSPYLPGHIHPCNQPTHPIMKQKKKKKKTPSAKGSKKREENVAYQISRRHCGSSRDLSHILRTRRPSNLASVPSSGTGTDADGE
jgi:hypothetical protein